MKFLYDDNHSRNKPYQSYHWIMERVKNKQQEKYWLHHQWLPKEINTIVDD